MKTLKEKLESHEFVYFGINDSLKNSEEIQFPEKEIEEGLEILIPLTLNDDDKDEILNLSKFLSKKSKIKYTEREIEDKFKFILCRDLKKSIDIIKKHLKKQNKKLK